MPAPKYSHSRTVLNVALAPGVEECKGSAKVYVDGVEVATVNLHRPYRLSRRVVWQQAWAKAAERTIRIEVLSGRVDVDGLAVLR